VSDNPPDGRPQVRVGTVSTERCEACGAAGVVLLDVMAPPGEEPTQLRSCNRCETRSWWRGGQRVPVEEVLGSAARTPSRPRKKP
jgi:hypothetical protein